MAQVNDAPDTEVWRDQVRDSFKEALHKLHSRPGVPSCSWFINAAIERAMRYAIERDRPEELT